MIDIISKKVSQPISKSASVGLSSLEGKSFWHKLKKPTDVHKFALSINVVTGLSKIVFSITLKNLTFLKLGFDEFKP